MTFEGEMEGILKTMGKIEEPFHGIPVDEKSQSRSGPKSNWKSSQDAGKAIGLQLIRFLTYVPACLVRKGRLQAS